MVSDFKYYTPTEVRFGRNTANLTGELAAKYGAKRVLVHYGMGSVVRSGLLDIVKKSLDDAGIYHIELGGAVPNPRLGLVYDGIELCKRENIDFIIAVGGGSAVDSAKAIGYGLGGEGDVWDYYDMKRVPEVCAPIGVVITLAATGSEMSNSSVITNEDGMNKRGINYDCSRPWFAVMDPALTMTLPDYQTQSGCVDILMHTLERYFDVSGSMELTDQLCEALLRTVMKNALILHDDPLNYDARAEVLWAGSLSHNGLMHCGRGLGDWACHKMEHELGGMFDVAHGAGLAAIWATWARYVLDTDIPRFSRLAKNVLDIPEQEDKRKTALMGIDAMESFFKSIDMPTSLRTLGIDPTEEQFSVLAKKCITACGGKYCGHFKLLDLTDVEKIYRTAY